MKVGASAKPRVYTPAPTSASFKKSKLADRGKEAEDAVRAYLEAWAAASERRDFDRLVDTKAAGRTIRAAPADFEAYALETDSWPTAALIEVKETRHAYRLDRSRLTQMPRLRKRAKAGVHVYVLVYHSVERQWRCMTPRTWGEPSTKGSWDLRPLAAFRTPGEALVWADGYHPSSPWWR